MYCWQPPLPPLLRPIIDQFEKFHLWKDKTNYINTYNTHLHSDYDHGN